MPGVICDRRGDLRPVLMYGLETVALIEKRQLEVAVFKMQGF